MAGKLRELQDEIGLHAVIVLDIPLLVEANAEGIFDYNLVVDAPPEMQVERLISARGYTAEEAWARIRSQAPREERLKSADYVIHNERGLEELRFEVDAAWDEIVKAAAATPG